MPWRDEPAGCSAPLVAKGAVRALDPFPISILGALEPDRLAAALQRGEESLAARFLYAWPALPPFRPLAERKPARDDEAAGPPARDPRPGGHDERTAVPGLGRGRARHPRCRSSLAFMPS